MARAKKTPEAAAAVNSEKKTAAAKKSAKVEVLTYLQIGPAEWDISAVKERVMEAAAAGRKTSEIKTLAIYLKPEESKIYYTANDNITGSIDL